MRYQVPQFVDIEDKIIGPLTLKQFLVYIVAVLLLIPVYLRADLSLFLTIALPSLGVAALFAHFRLHGKSLFAVASNVLRFFSRGQFFIWRRMPNAEPLRIGKELMEEDYTVPEGDSALQSIARSIETQGNISNVDAEDPLATVTK